MDQPDYTPCVEPIIHATGTCSTDLNRSLYICSTRPSNIQEPVACTPEQAPAACLNSGVDALVIGNYVIERNPVGMERRSLQLFLRCILIFSCYPDALRKASC